MTLAFGVHTGLQGTNVDGLRELWQRIEMAGFTWISIWDHFYAADASGSAQCLEAVAMHAALVGATQNVRCGSLVYSVGYRHPAVLANTMATLDHLSNGRITLGMGAGWHQLEYDAYGIPFPPAAIRLQQLEEGIRCVRGLLTEESVDFSGTHFNLRAAQCEPKPLQNPLPIWIGGGGEKVTMRIAAQYADGWNVPFVSPDEFKRKVGVLNEHCERLGRDPSTVTKAVNVGIGANEDELETQFGAMKNFIKGGSIMGSADEMTNKVGEYGDAGAEWVILAARAPFQTDTMERFAADVMPLFL